MRYAADEGIQRELHREGGNEVYEEVSKLMATAPPTMHGWVDG